MEALLGKVLGVALAWVFGAIVLMIVSRLGLGLSVDGFVPAVIASAVISIVSGLIIWALGFFGISVGGPGFLGAIVSLVVSAIILLVSDRFVSGMKVNGFGGALIAAIAYGAVVWLISWLLGWVLGLFMESIRPICIIRVLFVSSRSESRVSSPMSEPAPQPHSPMPTALVSRPGIIQQSLRASFAACPGVEVVGAYGDGLTALNAVAEHAPALLVIDCNLL